MKRKKKKGSSFVIVLFITAIIFTTATTMIAVVSNDYKTRINQSKSLQNLYESDSNIDYAYTSIVKNAQMAALIASNKVEDDYRGYSEDEIDKQQVNQRFKKYFIEAISGFDHSTGRVKDVKEKFTGDKPLFCGIEKFAYMNYADTDQNTVEEFVSNLSDWTSIPRDKASDTKSEIKVTEYEVSLSEEEGYKVFIKLESTFENKGQKSMDLRNRKTIRTSYTIEAPDYNGSIENDGERRDVKIYNVDTRAITADGDMIVNGDNVKINGDVWIKGNSDTVGNNKKISYDKYYSGVVFGEKSQTKVSMNGNIYTPRTVTLQNKAEVNVSDSINALNVYLGTLKYGNTSSDNILTANTVMTNNDLTMNSDNSLINIKNYYGINDQKENATLNKCSTNSSSIIVNKTDSKLKIGTAYVMGLAYIDTNNSTSYQTGESVAVKGNYKAYSTVLPGYENQVQLSSIDSVKLIKEINGDSSGEAKAKYFDEYFNKYDKALTGGVYIDELYANGASVNENSNGSKNSVVTENMSKYKQRYARFVFDMGFEDVQYDDGNLSEIYTDSTNDLSYVQKQVAKNGDNNGIIDFSKFGTKVCDKESIMVKDISYEKETEKKIGSKIYDLVLNGTQDQAAKDVVISLKEKNGKKVAVIEIGKEEKYVSNNETVNCVLLTAGNVTIKDDVKYNGAIIAGGNVQIDGDNIEINYDKAKLATTKLAYEVAFGQDMFNNIYSSTSFETIPVSLDYYPTIATINKASFDAETYIKDGLWQLEK